MINILFPTKLHSKGKFKFGVASNICYLMRRDSLCIQRFFSRTSTAMQQYFLKLHSKCNDMKSAFLCQFTAGDFPVFLISLSTYIRFFQTTTVTSLTKLSFFLKIKEN